MDQTVIDRYKSATAPSSLKSRLDYLDTKLRLEKELRKKKLFRNVFSGIAACFLIAVVLTLALRTNKNEVRLAYGDTVVGKSPVALSVDKTAPAAFGMKSINYSGIPLNVFVKGESKVSVSDGTLYVFDSKSEELVSVVTDITLTQDALVRWDISGSESSSSELSVEANGKSYVYVVTFENGDYYIYLAD